MQANCATVENATEKELNDHLALMELSVQYSGIDAVTGVSFNLPPGVIGCLLGPSGCGKTTVLRTIAGFEKPTNGEVHLHGRIVSGPGWGCPPEQRRVGMVFQDLALFPHLNVAENISFGLGGLSKQSRQARVDELLHLIGMPNYGHAYPHHLSGGQQQRVAIARALAPNPEILLLDEPFSSLDVALRKQLPRELRRILRKTQTTALLVTHDQAEAFAMADVIGVMKDGRLHQFDTAYDLYHCPATPFVADFIGQGVRIEGVVVSPGQVKTELGILEGQMAHDYPAGQNVEVLVRPDDVVIDHDGQVKAKVEESTFRGANFLYTLSLPSGTQLLTQSPSHNHYSPGDEIHLRPAFNHLVVFPAD